MIKNAMLLSILCAAVLTQCDIWNKPLVDPLKEKVDELTSIKSIVVTRYPKKNAFQKDVDQIPKDAEEWSGDKYGLEVSGINGMGEARVLVPGLEYEVDEIAPDDDDDKSSYPFILTVTLVLTDSHRYGRMATEFKITILPPDVKSYTIEAYDEKDENDDPTGNRVVAFPSGFTTLDTEEKVAVYVYTAEGWALKPGTSPKYGFDPPPPGDNNDYRDIYGPPFTFTIYGGLIDNIKNDNSIYLWADFIEPVLMLTDSDGKFIKYYTEADTEALSTAIGSATAAGGGTITVMQNIQAGSETIEITDKSITLQAYDKAAGSVTVSRAGGTGSLFTIGSSGTLTLTGGAGTRRLVIDGGTGTASAALATVNNGGFLDMRGGVTLQNNYNEDGTGGAVHVTGGSFTMTGGRITGNSSIKDGDPGYGGGGGVYVSSGVFTMSGGMIDGNTGKPFGGGVLINGGDFDFTSGEISGNKAGSLSNPTWGGGGGIHVRSGTLTMSGNALIGSNSVSNGGGGGVAVSGSGYFEMKGGEIRNNSSQHGWIAGGGVILFDDNNNATPSFNMSGGKITGNKSYELDAPHGPLPGAGVFFHNGTFSMSGSALITQDNDVRLALDTKSISIDKRLEGGTQLVALISLPDYVLGREVLTGTYAGAAGTRFSLTEPGWSIVDGKLTNLASSSSGGEISTEVDVDDVRYQVHTFKNSGDFVSAYTGKASILLVGGGGGGGSAGGGGAGGFFVVDNVTLGIGSYAVTVGTGGAGSRGAGSNGGTSSLGDSYTAYGGGGGGGYDNNIVGKKGSGSDTVTSKMGSGGGGGFYSVGVGVSVGGTGSTNGGSGKAGGAYGGGGGGGAGGNGGDSTGTIGGKGGSGTVSTISGGSVTYATGGTGSVGSISAQANTGNGGDGGFGGSGANGGSGIVIIRFPIQ